MLVTTVNPAFTPGMLNIRFLNIKLVNMRHI
jgi:hypothetical protein